MLYKLGRLISDNGKTKDLYTVEHHPSLVAQRAKTQITAGDGARRDEMAGKDILATTTTANVFHFLRLKSSIPLAFIEQLDPITIIQTYCRMINCEVVVRRRVNERGSYAKRHPELPKGCVFQSPLVEFFLKTKDRSYRNHKLPVDDPLMVIDDNHKKIHLYLPNVPASEQTPFWTIPFSKVRYIERWRDMVKIAHQTFLHLEAGWKPLGGELDDLKVEFGISRNLAKLLLADVIDNDSWRLSLGGVPHDKQRFRDGESAAEVRPYYETVAELSALL